MVISQETHDSRVKPVQQGEVHDARDQVTFLRFVFQTRVFPF